MPRFNHKRAPAPAPIGSFEGIGMIPEEELARWRDFLVAQFPYFKECMHRELGGPYVAGVERVAFLETDEELEKEAITEAILYFIKRGSWPELTARQAGLLDCRVFTALGILANLAGRFSEFIRALDPDHPGQSLDPNEFLERLRPQPPDPKNHGAFIRWLLIDLWEQAGRVFFSTFSKAFLAERGFRAQPRR